MLEFRKKRTDGFVYIIACEGINRIKIGFSKTPERRLQELSTSAPGQLELWGQWPGTLQDEATIHQRLSDYRRHLEWFEISAEMASRTIERVLREPEIVFRSMTDLYYVELNQAIVQAIEAGLLVPERTTDGSWAFSTLKLCPEHLMAMLPVCIGCNPDAETKDMYPVRWQVGDVFIDRTRWGFCVVSQTGSVWNVAGGWDSPPQPSHRDDDWYREHNFSNVEAAIDAAHSAGKKNQQMAA